MREMDLTLSRLRSMASVLSLAVIVLTATASSAGQTGRGRKGVKVGRQPVKRYVVEGPLSLNMSQCQGELEIPAVGFKGGSLDIRGNTVTLTTADGATRAGTVIAYARSAYYLDSNVSLSFVQTSAPVSSAEWRPPLTISLLISQSRTRPKEVTVSPVRGALTSTAPARLRCAEMGAAPKKIVK
ncbi:MAG: hypothetical protein ACJ74T_06505 [Pyrinomonadaceae bacterium]